MYHSATFGDKNTWDDWRSVPASRPVFNPPAQKVKTLEIPGGDGVIDLSQSLTRYPVYQNRTGSIKFIVMNDFKPRYMAYFDTTDYLHDQELRAILEDGPGYFYEGWSVVNVWKSEKDWSRITIDYDVRPYKWSALFSTDDQLWDPFNFQNGVIRPALLKDTAATDEKRTIRLEAALFGRAPVCPQFFVTSSDQRGVHIRSANPTLGLGETELLTDGTIQSPEFVLFGGQEATLELWYDTGTGTVLVDFRVGRLRGMYSIYADGVCIYGDAFSLDGMKTVNPKPTLEDSTAGTLETALPHTNKAYGTIVRVVTNIPAKKNGEEIWAGRTLSENKDFWNNRVLYCEGELASFNDSTQPPAEYAGKSIQEYLEQLIAVRNSKTGANRQFAIGAVTVVDEDFPTYYTNYEKMMELLNALMETCGGHFRVRKADGVRYLDYLKEYPDICSQVTQFGSNLIDFTRSWDSTEYATAIIPLGSRLDDSPIEVLDAYLTVKSVNGGSLYVQSDEAVKHYGWIVKTVSWDDVNDPEALLEKAREYPADLQSDNLELELSAPGLHYLDVNIEAVKLLDETRVIPRLHGLDRTFPVTKLEIPLDHPENTQFKTGDSVQVNLTSVNNQTNAAVLEKIEGLPKAHSILKETKENATEIISMATTSYITITRDEYGPDTLYISNVWDYTKVDKLWKWNMNDLGHSNDGSKIFRLAMTMDGSIVTDYVNMGTLSTGMIRVDMFRDVSGNFSLDMKTGTLTMKKDFINIGGNLITDEQRNLTVRWGTFARTLIAARGSLGGVVQAENFPDPCGNSMLTGDKFKAGCLDLYGLTVSNKSTEAVVFAVSSDGLVTINGSVTMGAGGSINWAQVGNQDINSNPVYSMANDTYNLADEAYDYVDDAHPRADRAYKLADSTEMLGYTRSTYVDQTTTRSPVIEGGELHGEEFNIIAGSDSGSFNFYGSHGNSRFHTLAIEYYEGDAPYIDIYSLYGGYITIGNRGSGGVVLFEGHMGFSGATARGLDFGIGE